MTDNQTTRALRRREIAPWDPAVTAVRGIACGAVIACIAVPTVLWWPQYPAITTEVIRIDSAINLVPHDLTDVTSQSFAANLEQVGQLTPTMIANTNPPSIQLEAGETASFAAGQDGTILVTLHNIPSGQCRRLIRSTPFNMDWHVSSVNGNTGVESACFEETNTLVVNVQVQ